MVTLIGLVIFRKTSENIETNILRGIMIGRKTASALGEAYQATFVNSFQGNNDYWSYRVDSDRLYDFLYENDFPIGFCNRVRSLGIQSSRTNRELKDFIIEIQTGEFAFKHGLLPKDIAVQTGSQQLLVDLAKLFLNNINNFVPHSNQQLTENIDFDGDDRSQAIIGSYFKLLRSLELDGYIYREPDLFRPEQDIINVEEERRTLHVLYKSLNLDDKEQAFKFLDLSEEHYIAGRWEDAIGNARKFFEQVLSEVANSHSIKSTQQPLAKNVYEKPVEVRIYLQNSNLMEEKEVKAIAAIYSLLSETGGHPKTAKNDQARLLRHLALTLSQFAMLRLEGFLKP